MAAVKILFVLTTVVAMHGSLGQWCPSYMFNCGNGICIQKSRVCDGTNDCGNWADEQNCDRDNSDNSRRIIIASVSSSAAALLIIIIVVACFCCCADVACSILKCLCCCCLKATAVDVVTV